MSGDSAAPVLAGLVAGIALVALFSAIPHQLPPSVDYDIGRLPEPIKVSKDGETPQGTTLTPYTTIPVNKSREIVISNSGWGMGMRHVKTLMTIDSITIYYNDQRLHQNMPDLFEQKDGFFAVFFNYTMKNLGDREYYASVIVDATAVGKTFPGRASGGALTSPLYPGESKSSWQLLDIPEDADEVTLNIKDQETGRIAWTMQLDMQPHGLKPSKQSSQQDFSKLPDDFALTYSYGYGQDITVDTKKGMIVVKTCDDPALQNVTLNLSEAQLATMWQAVLKNDFFTLPDFTESCPEFGSCAMRFPESSAVLKVTGYNQTHRVDFRQNFEMNLNAYDSDFAKYKEIRTMLEDVIAKYELPESKCAYA